MRIGFGKRVKPRQFDYMPRYYDEAKDKLDSQVSKYHGDVSDEDKIKERIKSGMRQKFYGDADFRRQQTNKSNLRLVYIIIVLCFVTYMV
ncbi:MAG: hypothetical protein HKN51_17525, partial [Saprospiraceae bacterium]|nr:hypothetical protein [Saprospiraceae bacterium]